MSGRDGIIEGMTIHRDERTRRDQVEAIFRYGKKAGLVEEVDVTDQLFWDAVGQFTEALDDKLNNANEGEYLQITWQIDIIQPNGKVRSGSSANQRSSAYTEWRDAVYKRDNYICQDCGAHGQMNAHHIKRWSSYPELRYDVDNGKTVCFDCHAKYHPHIGFFSET